MTWTLQSLIDGDMTVRAYCHLSSCNHNSALDLIALRDKLGPDAPAMADDLVPRLRCSKCGGRKIGLIYTPAGNSKYQTGGAHNLSNAYREAKDGR